MSNFYNSEVELLAYQISKLYSEIDLHLIMCGSGNFPVEVRCTKQRPYTCKHEKLYRIYLYFVRITSFSPFLLQPEKSASYFWVPYDDTVKT